MDMHGNKLNKHKQGLIALIDVVVTNSQCLIPYSYRKNLVVRKLRNLENDKFTKLSTCKHLQNFSLKYTR